MSYTHILETELCQDLASGKKSIRGQELPFTQVFPVTVPSIDASLVRLPHRMSPQSPGIRRPCRNWRHLFHWRHRTIYCIHSAGRDSSHLCPRQFPSRTLESGKIFSPVRIYCPGMGDFDCPRPLFPRNCGSRSIAHELDLLGIRWTYAYGSHLVCCRRKEVVQGTKGNSMLEPAD